VGGVSQGANSTAIYLTSAELYQRRLNRWSPVASMSEIHVGETATRLDDGRILVLGGSGGAELYDPARNRWSLTGPSMDRYQQTATRLQDGRVLITGGYGIESLSSVLVYDSNGLPPSGPPQPVDRGLLITLLLVGAAMVPLSMPPVRRRLRALKPDPESEEWISS
jgi:hypothetical protein